MAGDPQHDDEHSTLGKAYDPRLARRLLAYVRPYRGLVAAALVFLLLDGLLQVVGPLLTRRVIDVAIPARDAGMVRDAALLYGASLVAQFACTYAETILTTILGQRVMYDLRLELFTRLQQLSVAFFDRNPAGRLITRVTSDVESLNELFTAGVVAGLGDLFALLTISVMMWIVEWRLALATFLVIPFVWLTSRLFQRNVRDSYRAIRTRLARINAFLQERLSGVRIVQLFGRERDERARFAELNADHLRAHLKSITVYALYFPAIEVLTAVALASLIVGGASAVHATTMTVGTVAAFLQLVRRFFQPLQDLSDKYNTLQQAMASSERIFGLLDEPVVVPDVGEAPKTGTGDSGLGTGRSEPRAQTKRPHGSDPFPFIRSPESPVQAVGVTIAFEDVWFAYDAAHRARGDEESREPEWVLRGVSFTARPGQTIALVGHTGAGKTTILNLLLRFYDVTRGRITLMDAGGTPVDIREMPLHALRARIGYVQQDIFLFAGDVASNIRLSADLPDEAVAVAAARVGADRLVRRLPGGWGHVLGERGASLSVGERQLLSFARAIAADPALLLLDEATSAVDSELEAEIQRALAVLMAGRTTIAVAHRISTIVEADEILVLHHGRIVERGRHTALLAAGGLYERLYRLQVGSLASLDARRAAALGDARGARAAHGDAPVDAGADRS